jgi:dTDP-4-dehydrorhamnose reductase
MTNILVTGANGQLGSELRKISKDLDHHFYFTDIEHLDLTDISAVYGYFEKKKISFCINCAAYTAVDKAESDIENAIAVNVNAVKNLAEVCEVHGTLLVHISSDFVFNGRNCRPYMETDKAKPINVYGQSKYEGEFQAVKENYKTIIIRTSWLYSSFGSNFVKTMLINGKEKGHLNVIIDQVGTPTYASDLAEAIIRMVDRISSDANNLAKYLGIYHFSNEGVASWYDFAIEIFKISGITCKLNPVHSREYPAASIRPHFSVLDKTKIKMTFDLAIPYWKDSLAKCIKELGY